MPLDFTKSASKGRKTGFADRKPRQQAADPLADVKYSGDMSIDAASELTAMQQAYRDRASAEAKRFKDATDSEFWVAICFESREAKESFIEQTAGSLDLGDKYIDGHKLAAKMGIDLGSDD